MCKTLHANKEIRTDEHKAKSQNVHYVYLLLHNYALWKGDKLIIEDSATLS